jgi:nucleotide-binding universal stress UspA family protein
VTVVKRILAAVDTSVRAPAVVRTALELASQFGAGVVLFRAVDVPAEFPPAAATTQADPLRPKLMSDAVRELEKLGQQAAVDGVETTILVVPSTDPSKAIVAAAADLHADAIVIGSHGYRIVDRLIGTNAARVADRAKCMVVVVHDPAAPPSSRRRVPYRGA